jgi:hypothetical protein
MERQQGDHTQPNDHCCEMGRAAFEKRRENQEGTDEEQPERDPGLDAGSEAATETLIGAVRKDGRL